MKTVVGMKKREKKKHLSPQMPDAWLHPVQRYNRTLVVFGFFFFYTFFTDESAGYLSKLDAGTTEPLVLSTAYTTSVISVLQRPSAYEFITLPAKDITRNPDMSDSCDSTAASSSVVLNGTFTRTKSEYFSTFT